MISIATLIFTVWSCLSPGFSSSSLASRYTLHDKQGKAAGQLHLGLGRVGGARGGGGPRGEAAVNPSARAEEDQKGVGSSGARGRRDGEELSEI